MALFDTTPDAPADETAAAQVTEQTPAVESTPAESAAIETSGGEGGHVEQSVIDEELASLASEYQLDPKDFGNDPSRLRAAAAKFDRQLAEFARSLQGQRGGTGAGQPPATQPGQAKSEVDFDKLLPDLTDTADTHWEEPLKALPKQTRELAKALHEHYKQRFETLQTDFSQRVEGIEGFIRSQEEARTEREVDGFFSGLGKEWEGEFGKGAIRALSPSLVQRRNEVYGEALALQAGYLQMGRQPPALDTLLKRALHSRYADQNTTFTRQQLIREAAEKKQAATGGAASKRSQPATPRDRALQVVREGLKQLNGGGPA